MATDASAVDDTNAILDAAALESLSTVITSLQETPYSASLHYQHITLSERVGLGKDEVEAAREMMTGYLAAGEDVWLPLLESKKERYIAGEISPEEMDTLFTRAEEDYLSIPILSGHLSFLIEGNEKIRALGEVPTELEEAGAFFGFDNVQARTEVILEKAGGHMMESHIIWDKWSAWYHSILEASQGQDRTERLQYLQLAYLKRVATPHATNDATFQSYSTFVTNFFSASEYESKLSKASEIRQSALRAWANREPYQTALDSPQAYQTHIGYERKKRLKAILTLNERVAAAAKKKSKKGPPPPDEDTIARVSDPGPIIFLYERALADVVRKAAESRKTLLSAGSGADQADQLADAWLGVFWDEYIGFLRELDESLPEKELEVLSRAVRSVPQNGTLWVTYLRTLDLHGQEDNILDIYTKAIGTNLLDAKGIADVVIAGVLPTYRATREDPSGDDTVFAIILEVLNDAIRRIREKGGDERLRVEKFLVHVLLHPTSDPIPVLYDEEGSESEASKAALGVWESAVKHYSKHYHVWIGFVDFCVQTVHNIPRARKVFKDVGALYLSLDYPEAINDAWVAFEEMYGEGPSGLDDVLKKVRKMRAKVVEKREREAYKQGGNEYAYDATASGSVAPVAPSGTDVEMTDIGAAAPDAPIVVNAELSQLAETPVATQSNDASKKRKAEDEGDAGPDTKKQKPEPAPVVLKRDRENSTVFVAGLWQDVAKEDLESLFKDCGPIREIKISNVGEEVVATVEFMNKEPIPAALTKDKKRLQEHEVDVHLAWQSTVYVTNFPEKSDDASIRELFGKYGTLFDVRWPSKKFKNTRRFCYVQYISPASAREALVLDKFRIDDLPLSVALSNPSRKKERTDADVGNREIYVSNLSRNTTKFDLEDVFNKYGAIQEVRVALEEDGKCKGYAFVQFEQETSALGALGANNTELKRRRIAVTSADNRGPSRKPPVASGLTEKADILSRTVRVTNVPLETQEGLLQQTIEKIAENVTKVEVFEGTSEAIVEFKTSADASKLALMSEGVEFQGQRLAFVEEAVAGPRKKATKANKSKNTSGKAAASAPSPTSASSSKPTSTTPKPAVTVTSFAPRAAARPRAGLGHKKALGKGVIGTEAVAAAPPQKDVEMADVNAASSFSTDKGGKDQDAFRRMLQGGK